MMKEKEAEKESQASPEDQPDFTKIILATAAGIIILAGITYAGYRYSQRKVGSDVLVGCENCVGGTQIVYGGWDLNSDGVINDCAEACSAYWGSSCDGNSSCGNPGSTDPGLCCNCVTASGVSCYTFPSPSPVPTVFISPTQEIEATPTAKRARATPTP